MQHTIDSLAEQPRPRDASELSGRPGTLRLRAGTQELIYTTRDNVVLIIEIAHRSSPWHDPTHNAPTNAPKPGPAEDHNPAEPSPAEPESE
jgi:hypothetical protein